MVFIDHHFMVFQSKYSASSGWVSESRTRYGSSVSFYHISDVTHMQVRSERINYDKLGKHQCNPKN